MTQPDTPRTADKAKDHIPQYEADEVAVPVETEEGLVRQTDPAAPQDYDTDSAAGSGKTE